jgi:hypothetical protein
MPIPGKGEGLVYLIHFDTPLQHAHHYIGFVERPDGLEERMRQHRTGQGSRLMAAVSAAGIGWRVVRTWAQAGRTFERQLKERKNASRLCPVCRAAKEGQNSGEAAI